MADATSGGLHFQTVFYNSEIMGWTSGFSGKTVGEAGETRYRYENIKIFNVCRVLIENSDTRVTARYHSVRLVMPSSDLSDGILDLHQRSIMDYFSCILFL